MEHVEDEDGREGTDQEDHIEPSVVEIEMESTEDLGDYNTVLCWHIHPHQ